MSKITAVVGANLVPATVATASATFQINKAELYAPVVTLSLNNNIRFSEQLNQRFISKISWNRCRF